MTSHIEQRGGEGCVYFKANFWVVTPGSFVVRYQRFRDPCFFFWIL